MAPTYPQVFAAGVGAHGIFSLEREKKIRRGTLSLPEPDAALAETAALGFGRAYPGQSAMTVLQGDQAGNACRAARPGLA